MLSIAGIFIGLGLGILIGASITSDQSLLAQQQAMIDRLDADFAAMSSERNALTAELAAYKQYADETVAHIVGSSLLGQRVAVIAVSQASSSGVASLTRACETAGGSVGAVIKFDVAAIDALGEEHWSALGQALAEGDVKRVKALVVEGAGAGAAAGAGGGAGSVVSLTAGGCSSVIVLAAEADGGPAMARAVKGLSGDVTVGGAVGSAQTQGDTQARGDGAVVRQVVIGWVGAAPVAGRLSWMQGFSCTQVAGVGAAPGNAAAVLALAGAKGDYGRAPTTSFLPAPGAVTGYAVGGLR